MTKANPIGKIVYYALRIEFQMGGSPHLHALIWTSDCLELSHESKDDYIQFVDHHVQAYLPDIETDPGLYELVETYQKHSHSKTCRKYKNIACRFNFGQFFTERTVVAEPLPDDLEDEFKTNLLTRRNQIGKKQREILFTMISKNIYKNYKILKKIEKYIKMSNKNLRKTNEYTLRLGLLLELKKGEDIKTIIIIIIIAK